MLLQPELKKFAPRLFLIVGLMAFGFSALATTTKQAHWQNKHYIEYSFYDIALRSEYQAVRPVIKKWRKPLRVWASSTAGNAQQQYQLLVSHLNKLTNITQLPVQFVQDKRQANVKVYFVAERQASNVVAREISTAAVKHLKQSLCLGHIRYNQRAEITRASVVIPVERAQAYGKLASCVVEELTQMLGLINDSQVVYPTVFNDKTTDEVLTGLDYLLLKLLYAPEIKNGMTIKQAAPLVRKRLRYWEISGLIDQAEQLIQQPKLVRQ